MPSSTVYDNSEDFGNLKSLAIENIIKKDIEIVDIATRILKQRLELAEEDATTMSTRDVISSADVSAKRYSLFKGNATDDE
jgi:hypothetical protein